MTPRPGRIAEIFQSTYSMESRTPETKLLPSFVALRGSVLKALKVHQFRVTLQMRLPDSLKNGRLAASIAVLAGLGALWFLLTWLGVPELVFPSPASVAQAVVTWVGILPRHAVVTLARVGIGWSIGVPAGIAMGLLLSWSETLRIIFTPVIEAVRPLPPVALIPFFILWFGLGPSGQLLLIALSCFMVLTVSTLTAVQSVPAVYVRAGLSLGASHFNYYRVIVLPAILPSLFGGFRIAAALAFGVGIAAELVGAQSGIGFLMMVARRTLNTNTILLGVFILAVESFVLDLGLRWIGSHACRWTERPFSSIDAAVAANASSAESK